MKRRATVTDTSPDAMQVLLELLKDAPPWRKLELMDQWNVSLRLLVMSELRRRNPNKSENELRLLLAERLFGPETLRTRPRRRLLLERGERVREAVLSGKSFNLIALEAMFKIDVFIAKGQIFETSQLDRRVPILISKEPAEQAYVSSAEDVVLAKLIWYRKGGEISDRQWQDVLGVIRVQAHHLDIGYMRRMASLTGVSDLLDQALSDAIPDNQGDS